jgi:hypothetical protein
VYGVNGEGFVVIASGGFGGSVLEEGIEADERRRGDLNGAFTGVRRRRRFASTLSIQAFAKADA